MTSGIVLGVAGHAIAATLTVDDDGPADYASIQAALNDATGGDDILVMPGSYRETLNFLGKSVTVESQAGPAVTKIFLERETRIVTLNGDSTLRGFTITGGQARVGAGILVTDGASPTIERNVIEDNIANRGATGLALGGGIAIDLASSPVITRNVIRLNQAIGDADGLYAYGAGIDVGDDCTATITDNVIVDNTSTDSGAGISVGVAGLVTPVDITHNTIVGNQAGQAGPSVASFGGGILIEDGAELVIRNNIVADNSSLTDGGGIHFFTGGTQGIDYDSNGFDANAPNDCAGLPGNKCSDGQLFVTPSFLDRPGGRYAPRSDSPVIDIGSTTGLPAVDFLGNARNVDGDYDGTAAPDLGAHENPGTLTRLRFTSADDLAWDGSTNGAAVFELYRDDLTSLGGSIGNCLQPGLASPTAADFDAPLAGEGFLYLVRARDVATGSVGDDSAGVARTLGSPCP